MECSRQHAAWLLEQRFGSCAVFSCSYYKDAVFVHTGTLASLVIILSVMFAYQEKLQQFMAEIAGDDTAAGSRLRKAD